jgi:hypothetical protein
MKTKTPIVVLCSLAVIGLCKPARAGTVLTIDFVSTDTSSGDVLQGNLIINESTDTITGITNDFDGCCGFPDPSFTFSDLNGGNPLFNVGDSVTATAIPGTSQVISDSTTGVTLDWTSVTSTVFTGFVNVAFNGTGTGGGPNTIVVDSVVEDNFTPGDFVDEIAGTTGGGGSTAPEPSMFWLLGTGLIGVAIYRRRTKSASIRRTCQ